MLALLSPMALILVSWLLYALLFVGLGSLALKLLGRSPRSGWDWLDCFWLGLALALGLMQFWHFLFPVNDALLALLATAAALILLSQRKHFARSLRRLPKDKAFLSLIVLLALWLANRALGMPNAYDTGFRDMQAVMWIDSYPLVPGLGNLFASLAYNHSIYLYDALLDAFVWSGRSHHIATGLLLLVVLLHATKAAFSLYRSRTTADLRWSWIFATMTMPYVLFITAPRSGITHFLTDTAVDLLGFVSMIYLLDYLQHRSDDESEKNFRLQRLMIVLLIGLTVKQSFVVFGIALSVFAGIVWLLRCDFRPQVRSLARAILPVGIVASALLIPWLARGLVTTGYVAYPQPLGPVDVDWAMPVEQLQERLLAISANTRLRGAARESVLGSWDWLSPWLRRFGANVMTTLIPTLITIAGLGLHLAGRWRYRAAKREQRLSAWSLAPLLAALLIWFVTYPEPKYVRFVLWSLAGIAVILAQQSWPTVALVARKSLIFALAGLCVSYVIYLIIQLGAYPLAAGPDHGFHSRPPAAFNEFVTDSGVTLHVPTGPAPQCWNIPLPCTPYPNRNLEARVPGDLRHGFRISSTANADESDA